MFNRIHAAAIASIAVLLLAASAQAMPIVGRAMLDGAQEVPPNDSRAKGKIMLRLDTDTSMMKIRGEVVGISLADITFPGGGLAFGALGPLHIHEAPAGSNGPVQVPFSSASFFTPTATGFTIEALVDASGLNVAALLAGDTYFNLHTLKYPSGEIRGQIMAKVIPEPTAALLFALGGVCIAGFDRRRGR